MMQGVLHKPADKQSEVSTVVEGNEVGR